MECVRYNVTLATLDAWTRRSKARLWFRERTRHLFLAILILVPVAPVLASPPRPCTKAASSKNGNYLVIRDVQLEPNQDRNDGAAVHQVSFQVFTKTEFASTSDRFTSAATYWESLLWDVVLTRSDTRPLPVCAVPLLSEGGESLVLLNENAAGPADYALWIYRRSSHPGDRMADGQGSSILVKTVTLGDIWPADKFPKVIVVTDATQLWFAGGSFDFSEDNRLLTHDTRWGNSVRISLTDGAVSKSSESEVAISLPPITRAKTKTFHIESSPIPSPIG